MRLPAMPAPGTTARRCPRRCCAGTRPAAPAPRAAPLPRRSRSGPGRCAARSDRRWRDPQELEVQLLHEREVREREPRQRGVGVAARREPPRRRAADGKSRAAALRRLAGVPEPLTFASRPLGMSSLRRLSGAYYKAPPPRLSAPLVSVEWCAVLRCGPDPYVRRPGPRGEGEEEGGPLVRSSLSTQMRPPCASTMPRAIDRPSPMPSRFLRCA